MEGVQSYRVRVIGTQQGTRPMNAMGSSVERDLLVGPKLRSGERHGDEEGAGKKARDVKGISIELDLEPASGDNRCTRCAKTRSDQTVVLRRGREPRRYVGTADFTSCEQRRRRSCGRVKKSDKELACLSACLGYSDDSLAIKHLTISDMQLLS